MQYLTNSFSLNMLKLEKPGASLGLTITRISMQDVLDMIEKAGSDFKSAVGHVDTAEILSNMLNLKIPYNRETIKLAGYDKVIVAQYVGVRLKEGATELPVGSRIDFYFVENNSDYFEQCDNCLDCTCEVEAEA